MIAEHYAKRVTAETRSALRLAAMRRLRRAVHRYAAAKVADSWKGGGDPESVPEIERELRRARKSLSRAINSI